MRNSRSTTPERLSRAADSLDCGGSVPGGVTIVATEHNAVTCVSLPMFPELTAEEVDYVIAKVKEWDKARG